MGSRPPHPWAADVEGPEGFEYELRGDDVVIRHHGRVATTLRGVPAARFLQRAETARDEQAQHLMARATGNYKRGNERT